MRLRLALLASCIASPAFAQPVPAIDATAAAAATASAAVTAPHQQIATVSQGNLQGTVQGQGGVPLHMPPPIDPVSPDKPLNAKERAGVAVARRWINRFQAPHLDEDGVVHFTAGRGQVAVVTAIDHLTDIALAPGEIIAPPLHVGDDTAWKIHTAASGSGRRTISHVLVKPIDASLSTNLVIETNKRTISISLTSRRADYMPLVSLDIADDPDTGQGAAMILAANQTTAAASPCDQQPVITPDQFRIVGDNVPWRPVQVYVVSTPVGMKTCVEFPSDIGSQGLPAMLALADDGGWFSAPTKQMINVRYVRRRFVADELLSRFILVDGVGSDQRSVTVTRKKS